MGGPGVGLTPEDEDWFRGTASPQPIKPFKDVARLTNPARLDIPRTFIRCAGEGSILPDAVTDDWRVYELPTGHWPMVTMPRELADVLLTIIRDA